MEGSDGAAKAPSLIPPLPRDSRGSLEVFNPTTSFSAAAAVAAPATKPKYTPSYPVWHSTAVSGIAPAGREEEKRHSKGSGDAAAAEAEEVAAPWMAIKGKASVYDGGAGKKAETGDIPLAGEVGAAAQRAAEWGLVLRTDEETGKLQGVGVRKSGEDASRASRRNSGKTIFIVH